MFIDPNTENLLMCYENVFFKDMDIKTLEIENLLTNRPSKSTRIGTRGKKLLNI